MGNLTAFKIRESFNSKPPFNHKREKMELWQKLCLQDYFAGQNESILLKFPKKADDNHFCLVVRDRSDGEQLKYDIESSYFVGANWLIEDKLPILVEPKFNIADKEVELDFIKILFEALKNTAHKDYLDHLVFIDYDKPPIAIDQKDDILTPLMVVQYLHVLKKIVKNGLRKSYYRVTNNLTGKIKGKVLIDDNIKRNYNKGEMLRSYCTYDEFGVNYPENKLLKKALNIGLQHISTLISAQDNLGELMDVINYVKVGFKTVDDDLHMDSIKKIQPNPFFKDYREALALADKILKRFGYNVSHINSSEVTTPPFWIDMSKLFELFLLEKLNAVFTNDVEVMYQEKINGLYPDFLIRTADDNHKMVIDAKYKGYSTRQVSLEDIRQVSGYARINEVYDRLGLLEGLQAIDTVIDCLIIYPDLESGVKDFNFETFTNAKKLPNYFKISTLGIHVPFIEK